MVGIYLAFLIAEDNLVIILMFCRRVRTFNVWHFHRRDNSWNYAEGFRNITMAYNPEGPKSLIKKNCGMFLVRCVNKEVCAVYATHVHSYRDSMLWHLICGCKRYSELISSRGCNILFNFFHLFRSCEQAPCNNCRKKYKEQHKCEWHIQMYADI